MTSRLATDKEVDTWRDEGWVLLDGIVGSDEIDAVLGDLHSTFPTNEEYRRDPEGETERRLGRPVKRPEVFVWPDDGPGFRPEQQRWSDIFPFRARVRSTGCVSTRRSSTLPNGPSAARHQAVPDPPDGQVRGDHQLRAAHACRPQPFVVTGPGDAAVVESRGIPLSV